MAKTNLVRLKNGNVQLIDIDDVKPGLASGEVLEVLDDPEPEPVEGEDHIQEGEEAGVNGDEKEADPDQAVEEGSLHQEG
jgi:hypothetical protein